MTFATYEQAQDYIRTYGREHVRPSDRLVIVQLDGRRYKIRIEYKVSKDFIGYVTE